LTVRTLEDTAVRFEADIPWAEATHWSADVWKAAENLLTAAGKSHTDEPYQQTGIMQRSDNEVWQAFATFAGYAYDTNVCDEERSRLEATVNPVRVVRLDQVRAVRRRPRS
jgi:hypothetical protein